jgi:hypothetical protein
MPAYEELRQINEDCFSENKWTKQEIEELVVFTRLELYNRDLPCGPKAIRRRLAAIVKPLPSESTISRILIRRCLTHGRTGCYQ